MDRKFYQTVTAIASMVCITAAAMWFQNPHILWWYIASLLIAGDI